MRAAIAAVKAQLAGDGRIVEDGGVLAALARRAVFELPDDAAPTAERYPPPSAIGIVLEHCPGCGRTAGLDAETRDTIAAEARCDGEVVDLRPGEEVGGLSRTIPPRIRRQVLHRDRYRCAIPGCACRLWLDVHHRKPFGTGGDHAIENLVTLCCLHHRLTHVGRDRTPSAPSSGPPSG